MVGGYGKYDCIVGNELYEGCMMRGLEEGRGPCRCQGRLVGYFSNTRQHILLTEYMWHPTVPTDWLVIKC